MAVRELVMLAMVLTMGAAQASEKKDEGRFIITSANGNDDMINVTVGLNSIVMMSLALIGVVIAAVVVSQLTDQSKEQPTYHSAPSSYEAETAHDKSYAVHSYIENSDARYR
ncbi:uncharacterized protein LOC123505835 [Portunus trituberculatus]|uniref:uncharacterized protein LOC123505835 n=1 Tax=Portunus trituberculatus TaxID=210409 RepID=UPI001E1CEAFE|nr:uncharacterized protein LOC123505835 [Portunus trituberculatus]